MEEEGRFKPNTIRFLTTILKQPDPPSSHPLELSESDVVWSSSSSSPEPQSPPLSRTSSTSPTTFLPAKYGLSAALSDDNPPLLQRRPSLSAASAARSIRHVPRNHQHRPSSSFDDFSAGSGSGRYMQSAPVNIPVWPKSKKHDLDRFLEDEDDDDDVDKDEKMVLPPHEIVARSQTAAFSVFEGVGRTLKGRDLRRVRNAVFQQTGFLD